MITVYSDILTNEVEILLNAVCQGVSGEVHIDVDPEIDVDGYCIAVCSDEVHICLKTDSLIVLAHELVHAKQYLREELTGNTWKGKQYQPDHFHCPWEQQAYALENKFKNLLQLQ